MEVTVDHMIVEVLLKLADSMATASTDDYLLKVHGRSEYLVK